MSKRKQSRCRFVITIISLFIIVTQVKAQKELEVLRGWIQYSDAPNSLYHHIYGEAFNLLDQRTKKIASITTKAGWIERQQWLRKTLSEAVGQFPEKTPLNAKTVKLINKQSFSVEHIVYESRPGYFVTASLFLPASAEKTKAPVIIYCSGHSNTGYRSYQKILLNLVSKGFIVFAFDPIGQGERLQYLNQAGDKSSFRWPAWEHSYAGAQLFITGNTLARDFIWDGIRAIDYLETRKEVDVNRIGITGRSGGGTQSAYIAAFDQRIKAVAPENYITNYKRLIESIGAQDAEQNFFYGIRRGLDMGDLLAVRAPKPVLLITTSQDMFPIQGARETAIETERVYKAFGRSQDFAMVTDDAPHASTKKNRESMYAFFQKYLDNPGDANDKEVQTLTTEELQVTSTGQVNTALKSETAYSLNVKDAKRKMQELENLRKKYPSGIPGLVEKIKKVSGYASSVSTTAPIFTGRFNYEEYTIEKYVLQGSGDYVIPYLIFQPQKKTERAVIYLHPSGKFADTSVNGNIRWLLKQGIAVVAPDLIGTGETGPGVFKGDSFIDSVSYNVWFTTVLTGTSIVGIQASDVVKLVRTMKTFHGIQEISGLSQKQMAPVLLHAAVLEPTINSIALIAPYSSYRSIVMNPTYEKRFLHSTVPGVIGEYDLPDLAAALSPRSLLIVGVTDGNGIESRTDTDDDMKVITTAYQKNKDQLQIFPSGTKEQYIHRLESWIVKDKKL